MERRPKNTHTVSQTAVVLIAEIPPRAKGTANHTHTVIVCVYTRNVLIWAEDYEHTRNTLPNNTPLVHVLKCVCTPTLLWQHNSCMNLQSAPFSQDGHISYYVYMYTFSLV